MNQPSRFIQRGIMALAVTFGLLPALIPTGSRAGTGTDNTYFGTGALQMFTTGSNNTALGFDALAKNTTGGYNTATGDGALYSNVVASYNTACGESALFYNTHGSLNVAVGWNALLRNTTGSYNTANGTNALYDNTSGNNNLANGYESLFSNTAGASNTANGFQALYENTTASANTASGYQALYANTSGYDNTATGVYALVSNTTGFFNTAEGVDALYNNSTASENTAFGVEALYDCTSGSNNIGIGYQAGYYLGSGSNNIIIGSQFIAGADSNEIVIGEPGTQTATFIAGIHGAMTSETAIPVVIDVNGQLGTVSSSRRFKREIKPMDSASEAILRLKPVTFQYKSDRKGTPQFGLIAEDVAEVNPDLVVRDRKGEILTVRYDAVNAMLLNEFLKQYRKVHELETANARLEATVAQQRKDSEATAARQEAEIKELTASLKEQASLIQKVAVQAGVAKLAPQIAANRD